MIGSAAIPGKNLHFGKIAVLVGPLANVEELSEILFVVRANQLVIVLRHTGVLDTQCFRYR